MKQNFNEHYASLEIEPIEIIKKDLSNEQYIGYIKGNIIKYTLRNKEPLKDASKCSKYAEWFEEAMERQSRIPEGIGNLDYTNGSYTVEGIPLAIRKDGTTWCTKRSEFETPEECKAFIKKTLEKRDKGYYVELVDKHDKAIEEDIKDKWKILVKHSGVIKYKEKIGYYTDDLAWDITKKGKLRYIHGLYYQTKEEAEKQRLELLRERKRHFDNKYKNNN